VAGVRLTQNGELIEVRDGGLLILLPGGLTLVDYAVVREATFPETIGVGPLRGRGTEEQLARLARFSRYPFGLKEEQLARLLEALGQDGLVEIGG
jgi:hypothetical protein